MKWAHLPVAGGLYDQHPEFISLMSFMFAKKAEAEAKRDKEEKAKAKNKSRRHG